MLVLKSLHIIFVVSWFAGLFYLPRLFVNHAMVTDAATRERLALMERKLYRFMTPIGILAVGLGLWLWFGYGFGGGWLHLKTLLVIGPIGYHLYCGRLMRELAAGRTGRRPCTTATCARMTSCGPIASAAWRPCASRGTSWATATPKISCKRSCSRSSNAASGSRRPRGSPTS